MKDAIIGSPATVRAKLAEFEAAGVQEIVVAFADTVKLDPVKAFADEFLGFYKRMKPKLLGASAEDVPISFAHSVG